MVSARFGRALLCGRRHVLSSSKPSFTTTLTFTRFSSTIESSPPTPPLLLKLRTDMKNALKAKDTQRFVAIELYASSPSLH